MPFRILKNPTVVFPSKYIILVSHMRANTSLLGHIFGSHNDISGYYEQHIGYYSWKSLIRLKLKFIEENPKEPVSNIYFDKVLHSGHAVQPKVFDGSHSTLLFVLRKPELTIKSIVAMYQRMNKDHPHAQIENAVDYYVERTQQIVKIARDYAHKSDIAYMDAEALIENTDEALVSISNWCRLEPALTAEYKMFDLTGKKVVGDSSKMITSGKVEKSVRNYDEIQLTAAQLEIAQVTYINCRNELLGICENKQIVTS